jgi:nicotinate-nucleotide pyrophosphorylase (carboxylating)
MPTARTLPQIDWDSPQITALVRGALQEDIGKGDATVAAIVPPSAVADAKIIARQNLVVAGLPLAERVFRALDKNIIFTAKAAEGEHTPVKTALAEISGRAAAILTGERTALNFLARLCGIATLTAKFVEALAGNDTRIRDTRKTTPMLRTLEKYAVRVAGGANHRFGLYDAILIKENHIALAGGVQQALDRAHAYARTMAESVPEMTDYEIAIDLSGARTLPVQIEVRNEAELNAALAAGASDILLDNVTPAEAGRLVGAARAIRRNVLIEISGGITLSNAQAYAQAGADFLSSGSLTHSAPAADLSLLVETPAAG